MPPEDNLSHQGRHQLNLSLRWCHVEKQQTSAKSYQYFCNWSDIYLILPDTKLQKFHYRSTYPRAVLMDVLLLIKPEENNLKMSLYKATQCLLNNKTVVSLWFLCVVYIFLLSSGYDQGPYSQRILRLAQKGSWWIEVGKNPKSNQFGYLANKLFFSFFKWMMVIHRVFCHSKLIPKSRRA